VFRRIAVTTLVAALAGGLAACGGSSPLSHQEYQQKLTSLGTQANQQAAIVLGAVFASKGDLPKLAPQLEAAGEAIGGYADELDGLTPPEDAAEANAKLVKGFRAADEALHEIGAAAKAGDEKTVKSLSDNLQKGEFAKELEEAGHMLKAAGYTLPQAQAQ
jgi:hypothetical protein